MSDESDDELRRNRGPSMAPEVQYPKFDQYDDWEPNVFPPNDVSDAFFEYPELRRSLSSHDLMLEDSTLKSNGEVNPSKLDDKQLKYTDSRNQNLNKYFYYDSPLSEETGVWIPISIPPMPKGDLEEWQKGFYMEGDYLAEGDRGWDQCTGQENKEMTMWEVFRDMLIMAREKMSSHASIDFHGYIGPRVSKHMLSEVWEEMAQTLKDANFGNIKVILEAEPPRWLPDSAASSCMLCNLRFHPIMRPRHHCRFCGGIFCNGCSKGRMLLPATFHTSNLQRVCDVCNVRLEPIQTFLIDQISRAVQLPTHDLTDLSTLRSWLNFPWSQSMEYEIYKATNTLRGCDKVGYMNPDKSIPSAILKQAKGLAILTVAKVGAMFTYNIGIGIVVAKRDGKSCSF
ncbi:unnamed protein product [Cuscuta campestris]|uniref:FYVE-type domain-containing protein n=1 Tax=Cuscuta campestris TaxID=132261 RepID=A0A484LRM9_9ASTE|nr:unnamed protein product [Cuscuta campestris]